MVDEDRAVAIAIERHTDLRSRCLDRFDELLRMRRPVFQIDVPAVRLVPDDDRLQPETPEELWSDGGRSPICAIDGDADASKRRWIRPDSTQVLEIQIDQSGTSDLAGLAARHVPRLVGNDLLDLSLDPLGELLPVPEKILIPLSW
jgi:hypothetical protein